MSYLFLVTLLTLSYQQNKMHDIEIHLSLEKDCLDRKETTQINFKIINNENKPFYLRTGNLLMTAKLTDHNNQWPDQAKLIESMLLGVEEYVLVNANSTRLLKIETQFFDQFIFEPGVTYSLKSTYSNTLDNKKDRKVKTLKGKIPISILHFSLCE